ncbi:hypothetical protein LD001_28790, partial [Pseudomonas kurunegalensis]|uniref:hypothetical protein n=1 Tax=Pseudomonas kurunegalensis TaxID=485880 RepID=UPI001CDBFCB3
MDAYRIAIMEKADRAGLSLLALVKSRGGSRAIARSYVCFGPIIPAGFTRECFGVWLDIASYKQGGRARLSQAL